MAELVWHARMAMRTMLFGRRFAGSALFTPTSVAVLFCSVIMSFAAGASAQEQRSISYTDCGYRSRDEVRRALHDAVVAGEISDPAKRVLPSVRPRTEFATAAGVTGVPTVTPGDIFFYEDSARVLDSGFSVGMLFDVMVNAGNAVLADRGDNFDFIGYFLNFVPHHQFSAAFYLSLENDVTGTGDDPFDFRSTIGLAGTNVEGWVMMWNQSSWNPGSNDVTQLILGQEFEHRFGLFLKPLSDGRMLQGDNQFCGRGVHWNYRVDAQGSGMEMAEWVGWPTATRLGGIESFNTDFGGVFSAPDLYVMGYISAEELDTFPSELRYMDGNVNCTSPYSGIISTWTSTDLMATNGTRNPSSLTAQKHFRTAWIMIHRPGVPPDSNQVGRVVDILNDFSDTWESSTLGRGTMDNTLGVAFQISFPEGVPEFIDPETESPFAVRTTNVMGQPDPASGLLHFSLDGESFEAEPLVHLGGNDFEATLPGFPCATNIHYYVSFESAGGSTVVHPQTAPAVTPSALVAISVSELFADNFESDKGWSISDTPDLVLGTWERGTPVGGGLRGDPPTDFDGSGQCFLTENFLGDSDVDDGVTMLTSPPIDIKGVTLTVLEYAKWYSNDVGSAPGEDTWTVEVSANSVDWVALETTNDSTGWSLKRFALGEFIPSTDQLRIRFTASDRIEASVVEAAVDAVRVLSVSCEPDACIAVQAPLPELPVVPKNRYIAITGSSPGRLTAIRVTFDDLPPPFDLLNGQSMWVGRSVEVSQNGASAQPVPGFPNFRAAELTCEPFYTDWSLLGAVHLFHEFVVPGGTYSIQAIDRNCQIGSSDDFSEPLVATTADWGDTVGNCSETPCLAPDGSNNLADVLAILARFASLQNAVSKPRADIEPATPDFVVNISDALQSLDAFAGIPYSFVPSTAVSCPGG